MRKHHLAKCEECPFKDAPFVPTQNPLPAGRLAVIGEAPGAYEAYNGIPFTGPSGRLLDQVLEHHGYMRSDVMVTNICLCRPEDNDDPPKAAIAACKPRLDHEIATSGVEAIIAVGGTAASALIDPKQKITNLRVGPPKPYIEDPDIKVVATWHPAYCLRAPDAFPSLVFDIGKFNREQPEWHPPAYKAYDDPDVALEVIALLSAMDDDYPITIDIETGIEKDEFYEHPDQHNLLCIGIGYAPDKVVVIGELALKDYRVQSVLGQYLRSHKLIAHNGKSDLAGLFPIFGKLALWADTMLASYCLDERPGYHKLEKLCVEHIGAPPWKNMVAQYLVRGFKDFSQIPRHVLYEYNSIDVHNTQLLFEFLFAKMGDRERKEHAFLINASNAIMNLERVGITFDEEYSKSLTYDFENELGELELQISKIIGRDLNPRSPQQVMRYLLEHGINTETTEAEALQKMLEILEPGSEVAEFLHVLLKHRRRSKLYGTYVKGFQKRIYNGKVFTTYTLHGTTSGRLASKNPNLQNIVRDKPIKNQFTVEEEENVLIHVDFKQAEGRVITTLARDSYLQSIFCDSSRDIFNELTEKVYGPGNWGKEERVKIKSFFYGLSYGRKAGSIAVEFKMPLEEASELLENFKALIPATVSWQASITQMVLAGKDLVTPFGRKRSFWLVTNQNRDDVINEALSFLPQSIASDICLSALIKLQSRLEGLATTRLTIHDAIVFECREQDAEEVSAIAKEEMVSAGRRFTDYLPFEVDASVGRRWSEL